MMTLMVAGGNIVKSIPSHVDDFTEIKYEIEDSYDDKYIDHYYEKYYKGESEFTFGNQILDYVNSYYTDKLGFNEIINIQTCCGFHYYILNFEYDLYRCDECYVEFLDYRNSMSRKGKDKESLLTHQDLCLDCYNSYRSKIRKEAFKKAQETMYKNGTAPSSKQQKYICNLLNGKLNKPIGNFFVDILIDNIIIEYDGSGHFMRASIDNNITEKELRIKDLKRDKILQKQGYNIIRIESKQDLLPSDEEIHKLIKYAKTHFNKGNSFYRVVIDDVYDKNELRRINEIDLEEV